MTPKELREATYKAVLGEMRHPECCFRGEVCSVGTWCACARDIADAALAVVREALREPTPEIIGAWWRVKNGHHFHDEPAPTDTSDYAAYRAMLAASPLAEGNGDG